MTDQPPAWASLLSSIAAILNAIAWPIVVVWILTSHRRRIAVLIRVLTHKLSSAKKVKVGQFEVEAFADELKDAVTEAGAEAGAETATNTPKTVPEKQLKAAEAIKKKARATQLPKDVVLETVRRQIYDLAAQYEIARAQMQSGPIRTRTMNEIAAGMRALALAALPLRRELTQSESVGRRLAAICILQIEPRARYFRWLIERIKVENQAFVLYQASIAILESVKKKFYINPEETRKMIQDSIQAVSSYPGGDPDRNTLEVLEEALSLVS